MTTLNSPAQAVGVVILAAGRSARMGRPKLLLPWGDTSVLGHQIRVWQQLGAGQVAVVCAAAEVAIRTELDRLNFPEDARIFNPEPERGMFNSIQCAAQWSGWRANIARMAVVLGDQPHVRFETLQALLEFSARHANQVCQPRAFGRSRHPVILPKEVFARLHGSAAASLKEFLQAGSLETAACDSTDPGLEFDLDTPADYARALELCFPAT
jgi:molybdenum cofactor cytidylyltransferase